MQPAGLKESVAGAFTEHTQSSCVHTELSRIHGLSNMDLFAQMLDLIRI